MENLKVCITQFDQVWENKAQNFKNYDSWLNDIENCDIIILPEMFATGFSMNVKKLAEKMEDSESLIWLQNLAKKKNAAVFASFMVEENKCYYNRGVFVLSDGSFEIYDKRKTFTLAGESDIFTKGKKETIVHFKNWKINLQICYDLRFPEQVRNSMNAEGQPKYDLILYTANWPEKRSEHWNTLLKARAIENQSFVIGVNRIGKDGSNLCYTGDSIAINGLGEKISMLNKSVNSTEIVELSAIHTTTIQQQLPFLKDI